MPSTTTVDRCGSRTRPQSLGATGPEHHARARQASLGRHHGMWARTTYRDHRQSSQRSSIEIGPESVDGDVYARSRFDESDSMEFQTGNITFRHRQLPIVRVIGSTTTAPSHSGGTCGGAVVGRRGNGNDRREPAQQCCPDSGRVRSGRVRSGAAARAPVTGEREVRWRARSRPAGALGRSTCRTARRTRRRSGRAE